MEAKGQVLKQGHQSVLWDGMLLALKAAGAPAGFGGFWFRGVRDPGGKQRGQG